MNFDPTSSLPSPEVLKEICNNLQKFFHNPSGISRNSTLSKELLVRARGVVSDFLKVSNSEIIFTSSSTESNNLAIKGSIYGKSGSIITTDFEHPSILNPLRSLEREGYRVIYLPTDRKGWIEPEVVKETLREDTLLLTMGAVCRETATLRDIEGMIRAVREKNPKTLCHFDMWGVYYPLEVLGQEKPDLMSFDGPFLMASQGIGFLYVKKGARLKPIIEGGLQERGIRAGEENLFGIFTLSLSLKSLLAGDSRENLRALDQFVLQRISLPPAFRENSKALGLFSYGLSDLDEAVINLMDRRGYTMGYPSPCMVNRERLKEKSGYKGLLTFRLAPGVTLEDLEGFLKALEEAVDYVRSLT